MKKVFATIWRGYNGRKVVASLRYANENGADVATRIFKKRLSAMIWVITEKIKFYISRG